MMEFQGKITLITGAARGVGRVIAEKFAEKKATVVINDVDIEEAEKVAQIISSKGFSAFALKTDVSDSTEVENMVNKIVERWGRIDILVNNAAVFADSIPVVDLDEKEWDRVMNINLKGVFICSKFVARQMIKQKEGKIINITSFTGKTGRVVYSRPGTPTKAHYCASKAGIISLTKSLAYELAPYNINVNAVAPGSIATEATDENKKKMVTPLVPLGRMGTPQDIAACVLFLASPEASFITGEILDVNGGTLMD